MFCRPFQWFRISERLLRDHFRYFCILWSVDLFSTIRAQALSTQSIVPSASLPVSVNSLLNCHIFSFNFLVVSSSVVVELVAMPLQTRRNAFATLCPHSTCHQRRLFPALNIPGGWRSLQY